MLLRLALMPLRVLSLHWRLIRDLARREVVSRYRNSLLGMLWSILSPLLMLGIFTLFFGVIFRSRWSAGSGGVSAFAVNAFAGMLVHSFFSELLGRGHALVRAHPNFVKRVIFPLDALAWVPVATVLFHFLIYLVVLAVFTALVTGGLPPSAPLALLWILPMALIGVGLGWLLGALGVFFRDIGELMPFVATALMYISPVFYPLDSVPDMLRPVLAVNPLSPIIEGIRASLIHGQAFDIAGFLRLCAESWVFACGSGALFLRVRPAFADVV